MTTSFDLTGRLALVTGSSRGIGAAIAAGLADAGARIVLHGRDADRLEAAHDAAVTRWGAGRVVSHAFDVTEPDEVGAGIRAIEQDAGPIDILVNNAGLQVRVPLLELDPADWDRVQNVNMRSVFLFTKYCLPHIKGGAIVNTSSVHAHQTTPNVVPYASSKGAMEAFTRGLSCEVDIAQCRINCVAPGAVDTPMLWSNPNVVSGKEKITGVVGKPEDLAAAICFLAADEAKYITGTTLVVDGGRLANL